MSGQVVLAASAVITDAAGRVLLIRRGTEPGRGLWSVPGGSLDPGETLEEAAAREALEETGLIVEVGRSCGAFGCLSGMGGSMRSMTSLPPSLAELWSRVMTLRTLDG